MSLNAMSGNCDIDHVVYEGGLVVGEETGKSLRDDIDYGVPRCRRSRASAHFRVCSVALFLD